MNMKIQRKISIKNEIPVTYLCWGCGSSNTVYEESDLPIPAREEWNLCPDCILHDNQAKKVDQSR